LAQRFGTAGNQGGHLDGGARLAVVVDALCLHVLGAVLPDCADLVQAARLGRLVLR
jgi:hypothetical protein